MKFEPTPNSKDTSDDKSKSSGGVMKKIFLTTTLVSGLAAFGDTAEAVTNDSLDTKKIPDKNINIDKETGEEIKTADPYHVESLEMEEDIIEKEYQLFNTPVKAVMTVKWNQDGGLMPFYFNMHENEQTSVEAAKLLMDKTGGRLLELHHNGERLVQFDFGGKKYRFDPNRIFTPSGVEQTLKKYNSGNIPVEVQIEVYKFAEGLLKDFNIGSEKLVVALHNNTEGDYSIESYKPGGGEASATEKLHLNPAHDRDNFFYVTNLDDFQELKKLDYNVVLQTKDAPDDGSLSVYAGMHNIRYINPEAQHGHTGDQSHMLEDFELVIKMLQNKSVAQN